MTVLQTSFEGGTIGTTVGTTGHGGDAFTLESNGAGSTFVYDNTAAGIIHGSQCLKVVTTGVLAHRSWSISGSKLWTRQYIYLNALPGAALEHLMLFTTTGGSTTRSRLRISTAGKVVLVQGSNAVATSTMSLSLNTLYRIESSWEYTSSGCIYTAGIYSGNSTTPLESLNTGLVTAQTITLIEQVRMGTGQAADSNYFADGWAVSNEGALGPLTASATPSTVIDLWNGSALVRQKIDKWSGSALVTQKLEK